MGKEASQLSFCQWAAMIRVTVAWEHADAHSMNFTDIHCSEKEPEKQNSDESDQTSVIIKFSIV